MNTEDEDILLPVAQSVEKLFSTAPVKEMTVSQLRAFGLYTIRVIADMFAEKVQARENLISRFENMTDDQFEAYLKAKYGEDWMFKSLAPDEFGRVMSSEGKFKEDIETALHEGFADLQAVRKISR